MTWNEEDVLSATRAWVEEVVVGLNLCPFARAPLEAGRLRIRVTASDTVASLTASLVDELSVLVSAPVEDIETSLLVHPAVLQDFMDYNDFLGVVDAVLTDRDLQGTVQVASFHPDYIFGGTPVDDPANYTNRSPFPMLHLLRESSVSAAVEHYPNVEGIPDRNVDLLRSLGSEDMKARLAACLSKKPGAG